jgi:hypothetical protein
MDTQPVTSTTAAMLTNPGLVNAGNGSRVNLASFQADQPFDAYLLSLNDPATIAEAALTRLATGSATTGAAGTTAAALRVLAGTATTGGNALAGAVSQTIANPGGALTSGATGLAGSILATTQTDAEALTAQAAAQALDARNAAADAANADAARTADQAYVDGANADADKSDQQARQQADAQAASLAAANVSNATTLAAVATVLAEATGSGRDDWNRATDATAKFMGAGALAQVGDAGLGQAGLASQEVIPAVNQIGSARPMAANTYSNPQERAFGQSAATPNFVNIPAASPLESPRLDITG